MAYSVIWHEKVIKDLKFLERKDATKIVKRVKNYLVQNPEGLGKPLKGIFKGLLSYRCYGDFRVIYAIDKAEKQIIILHVKHRKDVYR